MPLLGGRSLVWLLVDIGCIISGLTLMFMLSYENGGLTNTCLSHWKTPAAAIFFLFLTEFSSVGLWLVAFCRGWWPLLGFSEFVKTRLGTVPFGVQFVCRAVAFSNCFIMLVDMPYSYPGDTYTDVCTLEQWNYVNQHQLRQFLLAIIVLYSIWFALPLIGCVISNCRDESDGNPKQLKYGIFSHNF